MAVFNRMQHTRLLFIPNHFIFVNIDYLNKNDTPPYGLLLNSLLTFIPDTPLCIVLIKVLILIKFYQLGKVMPLSPELVKCHS